MVLLTFIILITFITTSETAFAQTKTPFTGATPTKVATKSASIDEKISELKERIATEVAKLQLIQKRGILGKILETRNNQITVEGIRGNKRFIDVDELTKFSDLSGKQIGISDLKRETEITVLGLYNVESRRILARFVRGKHPLQRIQGEVVDVDQKNASLEVLAEDSKETGVIEVETTTKTQSYTKEGGLARSGFSKIAVGERVLIIGFPKGKDKLTAARILLLPELSPSMKLPTPTPTPMRPTPTSVKTPTPLPKKTIKPTLTPTP